MSKLLNFAWEQRAKLQAEGSKLWAEGDKLHAEGSRLWAEAVIAEYDNVIIEWAYDGCIVNGNKEFKDVV